VFDDGTPWLAIGTPGSANQTVSLLLVNLLHYRMGLQEAIAAPRFQFQHSGGGIGWRQGKLAIETRIP
jgi:gamma-glutamyltranspeptidase